MITKAEDIVTSGSLGPIFGWGMGVVGGVGGGRVYIH